MFAVAGGDGNTEREARTPVAHGNPPPTSTVPTERSDNSGEGSGENRAIAEKIVTDWQAATGWRDGVMELRVAITAALDAKDAESQKWMGIASENKRAWFQQHIKITQLESDKKALADALISIKTRARKHTPLSRKWVYETTKEALTRLTEGAADSVNEVNTPERSETKETL